MSSKAESPGESEVCGLEVEPAGARWPYAPPAAFTGTGALYGDADFDLLTVARPS